MKIYCPHCGVKGSTDESYSGRKVRCPKCQGIFYLQPEMAIDQEGFPSADLSAETPVEAPAEDIVQEDSPVDAASLADLDQPEAPIEESDPSLDLDELDDEQPEEEPVADELAPDDSAVEEPEEQSLEWDDFGAELDKEITESEATEDETVPEPEELPEEEAPADEVLIVDDEAEPEPEVEAESEEESEDVPADAEEEETDLTEAELEEETHEESVKDEIDEAAAALEDLEVTEEAEVELEAEAPTAAEEDIAGAFDEVTAAADEELEELMEQKSEDAPVDDNNNLGTLTAVAGTAAAAAPFLAAGDDKAKDDSEVTETEEAMTFAEADLPETQEEEKPDVIIGDNTEDVVAEDEPYGMSKEQCWQCGKKDCVGEPFVAIDGRLYCTECSPAEEVEESEAEDSLEAQAAVPEGDVPEGEAHLDEQEDELSPDFTVGGVMKEAWDKVRGIKGAVWAGSAVMYLILIVIVAGGSMILPSSELETETLSSYIPSALFQFITQALYMVFMGGLLFMGIRRVAGDPVSWKMIFHGFSFTGKIVVVTILQSILITIGFMLLILPGIYLTVGYAMAIPLIVDRNLSPWEAMETSRKAVHKVWWKVAGIGLLICLLFIVAAIPLGIGLIWVWPLALVASGVVYYRLFNKEE